MQVMYNAALFGARVLEWSGYILCFTCLLILIVYGNSHFHCILMTPEPGFEWECAKVTTEEVLTTYVGAIKQGLMAIGIPVG